MNIPSISTTCWVISFQGAGKMRGMGCPCLCAMFSRCWCAMQGLFPSSDAASQTHFVWFLVLVNDLFPGSLFDILVQASRWAWWSMHRLGAKYHKLTLPTGGSHHFMSFLTYSGWTVAFEGQCASSNCEPSLRCLNSVSGSMLKRSRRLSSFCVLVVENSLLPHTHKYTAMWHTWNTIGSFITLFLFDLVAWPTPLQFTSKFFTANFKCGGGSCDLYSLTKPPLAIWKGQQRHTKTNGVCSHQREKLEVEVLASSSLGVRDIPGAFRPKEEIF